MSRAFALESMVSCLTTLRGGIECLEFFLGRVQLLAADVRGRVDDLALQIARVYYVEVHQAQRAYAGRRQIERQRRTQPAGSDAKHARSFQFALAFLADFRKDQVARVASRSSCVSSGSSIGSGRYSP